MKPELKRELLRGVMRIRAVEMEIVKHYGKQQMRCPVHLCVGQEAVSVGACKALRSDDLVYATHRSHGPYLAKGGDLRAMLAELHGRASGCCGGRGGSMHLMWPPTGIMTSLAIVSQSIPVAAGSAFAIQMKGGHQVVMAIFGDAATEEGNFYETLNFSAIKKLPIVFVCENNGLATNTPLDVRRPAGVKLTEIARSLGIHAEHYEDGNDALTVYKMVREGVDRARACEGPTFFEFDTYRMLEHCGPFDDHEQGIRPVEHSKYWQNRCPMRRLADSLRAEGIVRQEELDAWQQEFEKESMEAMAYAVDAPFPDEKTHQDHIYA